MKRIIHIFSLLVLLFTYLLIPISSIAQTQSGISSSNIQSTEQPIEKEAEAKSNTQRSKLKTSDSSQSMEEVDKKDNIVKSTEAQPRAPGVRAVGDDPGVTINAPDNIDSNGQVVLNVDVSASAGNMNQDGVIQITIPKNIVEGDLTSQIQLPSPFNLDNPAYIDDGNGNYILNIKYNASDIDQSQALNFNFNIVFNAPIFTDHTTIPENVDFNANLVINGEQKSTDSDSSKTVPTVNGKPAFLKYTMAHSDGNGHYIMSPTDSAANKFIIIVNYNAQSYDDVTVTDTLPEGLSLADTSPVFSSTTGDLTPIKHINITKVVFTSDGGFSAESVTHNFESQITSDGKSFSVHLGKISPTDSYVISYGASVNEGYDYTNFGIEFNQAVMSNNNQPIYNGKVPLIMVDNSPSATSLIKSVDKKDLSTTEGKLTYSLTLNNKEGEIKAGTVVSDPLPSNTTYLSTKEHNGFSDATYNSNTNTVSYTLLEDIPKGSARSIQLTVDCSNPNFEIGDTIVNKAGFTANGTIIYSNDATTILQGSAELQKVDIETNQPLAGAVFKIIDEKGNTVLDNIVTDENGIASSGLLPPGNYSFVETQAPNGYVLDITPNPFAVESGQSTSVKLAMYNSPSTEVTGTKTWDDNNNQDGVRPDSIKVNLLANGQVVDTKTVTAADNWSYSFTGLPKYDKDGKVIVYTVTEDAVPGYTIIVDGFNLTNAYTPGKTSVTVTKAWDDNNNQDGLRPDNIQVQLYANGKVQSDPVTLNAGSDWTYTWSDLDQKADGKDIVYTVKEVSNVPGYEVSVDNSNQGNIIITNKHTVKPYHSGNDNQNKPHKTEHKSLKDFLPHTGDSATLSFITMVIGLVIIALGLSLTILNHKKEGK